MKHLAFLLLAVFFAALTFCCAVFSGYLFLSGETVYFIWAAINTCACASMTNDVPLLWSEWRNTRE